MPLGYWRLDAVATASDLAAVAHVGGHAFTRAKHVLQVGERRLGVSVKVAMAIRRHAGYMRGAETQP